MSTRSAPTPVAASDGDQGASRGGCDDRGTTLSGDVRLLLPGATSVRVRLDAGALARTEAPQNRPGPAGCLAAVPSGGGCGWAWRDPVATASIGTGVEVRRLGIADERGVAVDDVSDAVVAQVMSLLRVGPCSVAMESGPVEQGRQVESPDIGPATTAEQAAGLGSATDLWAGALDYGSVGDEETDVWSYRG